jgi:hypothetical protein
LDVTATTGFCLNDDWIRGTKPYRQPFRLGANAIHLLDRRLCDFGARARRWCTHVVSDDALDEMAQFANRVPCEQFVLSSIETVFYAGHRPAAVRL